MKFSVASHSADILTDFDSGKSLILVPMMPRLDPCRNSSEAVTERKRYQELGIPAEWWQRFFLPNAPKWIAPDEYFWTPDGYFTVFADMRPELLATIRAATGGSFYDLPLERQCELLKIPYLRVTRRSLAVEETKWERAGKKAGIPIEEFALNSFKSQGWEGERYEGKAIGILIAIVGDLVGRRGIKYFPGEWEPNSLPIVRERLSSAELDALSNATNTLSTAFVQSYCRSAHPNPLFQGRIFCADEEIVETACEISTRFATTAIQSICHRVMLGFGGRGWPDLTLYREGELRFVEVKQKRDKFTHRQPYWVRNFALPLGLNVEVLHVYN